MSIARSLEEFQIPPLGVKDASDVVIGGAVSEDELLSKLEELELLGAYVVDRDLEQLEHCNKAQLRNSIKMICFLAVSLAYKFESEACQLQKEKSGHQMSFWNVHRIKFMTLLTRLYGCDLFQLWEPPTVAMMEDYSTLLTSVCYRFLENSAVVRDQSLLEFIADVLGLAAVKNGLTLSVALKLIQLLQHFEHLANTISNVVSTIVKTHSFKPLVVNILMEIGSKDPADLVVDCSGTKSLATFLVALSGDVPTAVLPVLPALLPHLSGESVTFRNGILGVLGEVLRQLTCSDEGSMSPEARDMILQNIMLHLHDTHAFVRVKVLHILLQLCLIQVIPLPTLPILLERVTGRLRDRSSLVRKAALQLLSAILSNNPYSAKLDMVEFVEKLRKEEHVLECMGTGLTVETTEPATEQVIVNYLKAAINFITGIAGCIPMAVDLLRSKVSSDVLESLEFLRIAKVFQVDGAEDGIGRSLPLVWSQDERIRNGVVSTYVSIYLGADANAPKEHSKLVLNNLLQIISSATIGKKASLEKLVGLLVCGSHIPKLVFEQLWNVHSVSSTEQDGEHLILTCLLLSMTMSSLGSESNSSALLERLVARGLAQSSGMLFASHTCSVIGSLKDQCNITCRMPNHHSMFQKIMLLLTTNFTNLGTSQWDPFCGQALDVVYAWAEHPDMFCEVLLRDLSNMTFQPSHSEGGFNSLVLSRLLFTAGQVAHCQVIHCEQNIYNHRKKSHRSTKEPSLAKVDEELALGSGDDYEVDLMRRVLEEEVGGGNGLLAVFEPLLVAIIRNPSRYPCVQLQTAASLALAKFMLISSTFCEKYLQLLFTLLEKSEVPTIRANLIIVASDLVCRFPNSIESWTPLMYNRLRDACTLVRKNTIMVLTHLILNDMIKIRGQIRLMALCLEDEENDIREMAHMFFHELSLKGNTFYNVVPDIISQLSDPMCGTSPTTFRDVVGHLFKLLKKEKQHESLVVKLCHRIRAVRNEQQVHNLAYCLSLVSPTEKGLLKLQENFCCYKEQLLNTAVHKYLLTYVTKAKKSGKTEMKVLAEELENKMYEFTQDGYSGPDSTLIDGKLGHSSPDTLLHNTKGHSPDSTLLQSHDTITDVS